MNQPLLTIWNKHSEHCGRPPAVTNKADDRYYGYFENRHGEQWLFAYDPKRKHGELRGGDIGWDHVALVRDGQVEDVMLGKAEKAWLEACWQAATSAG